MSTNHSISDALTEAAACNGVGLTVIEHDGRIVELPYSGLLEQACQIGGALAAAGLQPGDRVALVLPEVSEFICAFFGISAAGLVPVPLCPPTQAGDLETFAGQSQHVLQAAQVAAVVTSRDVEPLLDLNGITSAPAVLTVDVLAHGPALSGPVHVSADRPALIQFTSGSTAAPKGVVLSHRTIEANVAAITGPQGLDIGPTDVGVSWLPLYHDMGLIGMLFGALYTRRPAVILSPVLFLKRPTAWLEAISHYRGTVSFAPSFAYELCRRRVKPSQIDRLDLSCWRVAGCGAEPIRPDSLHAFADHFARVGFAATSFVPSYGLAEHSLAVTLARGGLRIDTVDGGQLVRESKAVPATTDAPAVRLVSCGRPFPRHELRIVDEHRHELPERQVGAIVVRGPSVMDGYFEDAAATAASLRDGWLLTGDLGYLAGGELYVCGRTKDLIIRQGRKYFPPDLESAIAGLRGVPLTGVVVFGMTYPERPDEVVAVLEARAGHRSAELEEQVRRRVRETAGLDLDRIVVAPPGTIPRTTSGKVRRAETRARLVAGTLVRPIVAVVTD